MLSSLKGHLSLSTSKNRFFLLYFLKVCIENIIPKLYVQTQNIYILLNALKQVRSERLLCPLFLEFSMQNRQREKKMVRREVRAANDLFEEIEDILYAAGIAD